MIRPTPAMSSVRESNKVVTVIGAARTVPGCPHALFQDTFFAAYGESMRAWYAQDGTSIPDP